MWDICFEHELIGSLGISTLIAIVMDVNMKPEDDQHERTGYEIKTNILSPSHVSAAELLSVSELCKGGPPEAIETGR